VLAALPHPALAQWTLQPAGTTASLRGLSVVSPRIVWASGSRGTVVHTTDGGATWRTDTVPNAAALDFRDVKAFDDNTAYIMSAGSGQASQIFKTIDGGRNWSRQFVNTDSSGFFDAMAFWDRDHGMAMSDPVAGAFLIMRTDDGGAHWTRGPAGTMPPSLPNEGGFAASGTTLVAVGGTHAWLASGGAAVARVFHTADRGTTWSVVETPVAANSAGRGIFSLAFVDAMTGYAIGGDYTKPAVDSATAAVTHDGGRTWTLLSGKLSGYRSGSAVVPGTQGRSIIAVGTNGTDISRDAGATWAHVDATGLNSVAVDATGMAWAVGDRGRVAKWSGAGPLRSRRQRTP
jgi:photosystem II stability/assembly factor-like uncharacterized protein